MSNLQKYIFEHTELYENGEHPTNSTSNDAMVDLGNCKIAITGKPDPKELIRLIKENYANGWEGYKLNPLDGNVHNYDSIVTWIQNIYCAYRFMGLTKALGLTKVITPYNIYGDIDPQDACQLVEKKGMLAIKSIPHIALEKRTQQTPKHPRIGGHIDHPGIKKHAPGGRGSDE